jgi:hypothetical protein
MKNRDFEPFAQQFDLIRKITPLDVNPIGQNANTFRSGTFFMMRVKNNNQGDNNFPSKWVTAHRIVDDNSHKGGCFWTPISPINGSFLREKIDLAILPRWNKMTQSIYDSIPPGTIIYGGYAAPQADPTHSLIGGGLQFYIPKGVAKIIFNKQDDDLESMLHRLAVKQGKMMNKYIEKLSEDWDNRINNSRDLILTKGNKLNNLSYATRCLLANPKEPLSDIWGPVSIGVFPIHEEHDEFLKILIRVTVTIRKDKTTVTEEGNTTWTRIYYTVTIKVEIIHL